MGFPTAAQLLLITSILGVYLVQFSSADGAEFKKVFVDLHNKFRAEVGVQPLHWDDKLAAYAQNYANQRVDCQLEHSENCPYGECIALGEIVTPAQAVQLWYDEKKFYDHATNSCKGGECGHYTQIVWGASSEIGCGISKCTENGWTFVTCNYNPPGNVEGEKPY